MSLSCSEGCETEYTQFEQQVQQGKKKKYYHFKLQQFLVNRSNSMLLKEIVVTEGEGGDLLKTALARAFDDRLRLSHPTLLKRSTPNKVNFLLITGY